MCLHLGPFRQTSEVRISRRDFFYISNLLSLLRLLLTPFIFFSIVDGRQSLVLVLGGWAILSDALDGYFARRLDQQSDLGKILDPVADKAAIGAVVLALVLSREDFPLWAFGIVIFRDLLILVSNGVLFYKTRIISRSNWWGKLTSFFLSTALILYIFNLPSPMPLYGLFVGLTFAVVSIWSYSQRFFRLLQADISSPTKAT